MFNLKSKSLLSVMLFLSVIITCCFSVYADNNIGISIDETVNSDKTITAQVSFTPDVSAAGTIKLRYNTDNLRLISVEKGKISAQMVNINPNGDIISINYLNSQSPIGGNTEIAVIKFKIKSDKFSESDIIAEDYKLYDINSKLISSNKTSSVNYNINTDSSPTEVSVNRDFSDADNKINGNANKEVTKDASNLDEKSDMTYELKSNVNSADSSKSDVEEYDEEYDEESLMSSKMPNSNEENINSSTVNSTGDNRNVVAIAVIFAVGALTSIILIHRLSVNMN